MVSQELKKTLWAAADKLRSNMDAAEYKHIVLGLIFLKYVSDTFSERRAELRRKFTDPNDEYYLPDQDSIESELEDRDYYTEANVFWVPESARWENIRNNAKQPNLGKLIDNALVDIETENPRLKNILDKRFARTELEPGRLGELVDLISTIGFGGKEKARDVLGEVYEYFLGQFANAEGKKGGQFYTPASVVKVIVEIIAPHKGKVYDPCCGSGGMFVQSEKFIESHGGRFGDISIYGQEGNPTTWRLVAMNLAIRGMDFNLGKEPADTFTRDQHPDLRADYIMANPPFNVSDWWNEKLAGDARWEYGTPPAGNANFAWLSHTLYHLKPSGLAGVVLANGSMSSNQNKEQKSLAHILNCLEDKIELNQRMNETLESIAQALFKSWFVDFEPVKAKSEGRMPEGIDSSTAALFSSNFTESSLGLIPKGWEVTTVEEIAQQVAMGPFGSSIKVSTFVSEGIPVISGQHLNDVMLTDNEFNFVTEEHAEKLKKANVKRGDVIFTHAGNIGQVSYIPEDSKYERYVLSQRQFYLRCNEQKMSPLFMVYFFRSPECKFDN